MSNQLDSMDEFLSQGITKTAGAKLSVGTRVKLSSSIESMLMYPNIGGDVFGTIVRPKRDPSSQRTAFVKWDNGDIFEMENRYLSRVGEGINGNYIKLGGKLSNSTMSDFVKSTKTDGGVIHLSTNDLWGVRKQGSEFVLERMFDNNGFPIKEF